MANSNDSSTLPDGELLGFELEDPSDDSADSAAMEGHKVELGKDNSFPEVTKRFESVPHEFFSDPNYYKTALAGEGDIAQRLHTILDKYLKAKDPKDKSVYRPQIITAYWETLRSVARKVTGKIPEPKKFMLLFNLLHPGFMKAEDKDFFAKLVLENELNQPVYYVDEWLKGVGTATIKASTTDEVRIAQSNTQIKMKQLLEKALGKYDGTKALLGAKSHERSELENSLQERIETICEHTPFGDFDDILCPYNESQKRVIGDVQEAMKTLLKCDRELESLVKDYYQARADVQTLQDKIDNEDSGEEIVDFQAIDTEFDTLRQAAKMTVGRQGNHFPILSYEYFRCSPNDVAFRENIITLLAKIESIDPEVFCRYYKNQLNRIPPFIVLLPTYGDTGICWEPFDKHNRATSRGRVFIPMYPKDLYIALLSGVADLRWQVAKEKASYYWMEEGLTGNYYQWFQGQKLKGDVKDFFIQDYILWITKEAEGIQKLDKDVRGAFWRHMPFAKDVKEKLRNRSFVYQELCQRDKNREMSDGY